MIKRGGADSALVAKERILQEIDSGVGNLAEITQCMPG